MKGIGLQIRCGKEYFNSVNLKITYTDMFNLEQIENKITQSGWWQKAAHTVDCHYSNTSGVMLSHHLEMVYHNIGLVFEQPETGFYGNLFDLVRQLKINKEEIRNELKVIALLHDIGKTEEDKSMVISHPITGKPAHKRHGLVGLMAAMEILGPDFESIPVMKKHIYRTIELHDISYGLFREYKANSDIPGYDRWSYINNKINSSPAAGLIYLLIFKLADIHGHDDIHDVLWFYHTVKANYFDILNIELPIPTEADIR